MGTIHYEGRKLPDPNLDAEPFFNPRHGTRKERRQKNINAIRFVLFLAGGLWFEYLPTSVVISVKINKEIMTICILSILLY